MFNRLEPGEGPVKMEKSFFLLFCLIFLFLSTGNIEISEKEKRDWKNEISRSFSNGCRVHDIRNCVMNPETFFRGKSEQHIDHFSKNSFVNSVNAGEISKDELFWKDYASSLGAENRNQIWHVRDKDWQHGVKEMTEQFYNRQKIRCSVPKEPKLQACKTLFQYCNSNGKLEECQFFYENRTEISNYPDQLNSTIRNRLKDYGKSLPSSMKFTSVSSFCPTESIPFQTFSSTRPPRLNEFYNDPPWLRTLAKNSTPVENGFVSTTENQRATPAVDITDGTLIYFPTSQEAMPTTSSANTLEGSFVFLASGSSEFGSYSSSVLLSSSEGCQETSHLVPTPAMGTSMSSEALHSFAVHSSDVNTNPGSRLSASNDMYTLSTSSEYFILGSDCPGIIYPSPCASESSTGSSEVFSMYGFVDTLHDVVEY